MVAFTLTMCLRLIVPEVPVSSLSNKTATSQSLHHEDGAAAHSSCLTRRRIHHSKNAKCQIFALQAVQNGQESGSHPENLGPEGIMSFELSTGLNTQ
jgi:hypothetical protein